ncbi:DUF3108 domain-containing protein [uncultured Bacteroides sp.]|uniref:DUF3108 domain-containing protein n=1 Tax=uncultured Bacteroides sp. TaxID=162156 RepID=UPI0025D4ABE4|nr:DUF3108 domain-containing protein [uncultured Bacteroides sp.]
MIKKIIFCLLMTMFTGTVVKAQCGAYNDAIKPGEELTYELKFNWKFIWINAGWAKMTVDTVDYNGRTCLQTDLESYTNKRIDMFFRMRDTLTCITSEDLVPLYFRKGAAEGKRYSVDDVKFSYRNGKCIVDQYRTVNSGNKRKNYQELPVCVYDMLSILLQARSYNADDYKPGDKILFSMATGVAVEKQTLIYRRKDVYEAENGMKFRCLVFSLVEYVKGEEKEVITFYITDDRNHLPVRLDMYLNFGSAKAFLTNIKGNRHPLESLVK